MPKVLRQRANVIVASDHAGFAVKEYIKCLLVAMRFTVEDVGTFDTKSVDYPDYIAKAAVKVGRGVRRRAIVSCGSGIGASMVANKVPGVRAALVDDAHSARLSRQHNNANVLVVAGRPFNKKRVKQIVAVWLTTRFEGGRHARRIRKISQLEKRYLRKGKR